LSIFGKMKNLGLNSQVRRAFQGHSRGFTLIEVLIALALFSIIAITFLGGLTTASMAVLTADVRATAENLARAQMEYVKNQDYIDYYDPDRDPEDYAVIGGYSEHYDIEIIVEPIDPEGQLYPYDEEKGAFDGDDGLQKITVTVSHEGRVIFTLAGYKRNPEI